MFFHVFYVFLSLAYSRFYEYLPSVVWASTIEPPFSPAAVCALTIESIQRSDRGGAVSRLPTEQYKVAVEGERREGRWRFGHHDAWGAEGIQVW